MGILDSALADLTNAATREVEVVRDQFVNYAVAPLQTLAQEGFDKITSVFKGAGPFSKLTSAAATFEEISAAARLDGLELDPTFLGANSDGVLGTNASSLNAPAASAAAALGGTGTSPQDTTYKVKLESDSDIVEFDNMPEVTEARGAEYEMLQTIQMPGDFQKYKGTKSTTWTINALFTARTRAEAGRNYNFINLLRSWTMPYFGEAQLTAFKDKLGAPPPVLQFSGWRGVVGEVPVVITSLNWNWPKDCDWLPTGQRDDTGNEIPFPSVMTANISFVETFSAEQFNGFDLTAFKAGKMIDAFLPFDRPVESQSVSEPVGGAQSAYNGNVSPAPPKAPAEAASAQAPAAQPKAVLDGTALSNSGYLDTTGFMGP